jgi:proline dehydrogenase
VFGLERSGFRRTAAAVRKIAPAGSHQLGQAGMGTPQLHIDVPASIRSLRCRRASAYRAGPGLDEAIDVCRRLAAAGLASTVGYSAPPQARPRAVADAHLAAFDRLSSDALDCYVSLKLSAIGFDAALFAEVEAAAARSQRRVHVDALAPETVEATWRLLDGASRGGRVGTTLPGRWRRSADDASRAARLGLAVRIVKGQWADSARGDGEPVEDAFLRVVDRLGGHPDGVAVATHDVGLLRESLRRLRETSTPCEAELFYGLPFRGPALCARRAGVPIRMYVPYGDAGAPYGRADLVHHRAAAWWLVQDLLLGKNKTWRGIRRSRTRP